mmetsp:Transcript_71403/g.206766  ORF Transcript_71403/g.206766 Transcript_71403/m.206766 type:complete len:250 (-) Transcript_71403:577-1326(-)
MALRHPMELSAAAWRLSPKHVEARAPLPRITPWSVLSDISHDSEVASSLLSSPSQTWVAIATAPSPMDSALGSDSSGSPSASSGCAGDARAALGSGRMAFNGGSFAPSSNQLCARASCARILCLGDHANKRRSKSRASMLGNPMPAASRCCNTSANSSSVHQGLCSVTTAGPASPLKNQPSGVSFGTPGGAKQRSNMAWSWRALGKTSGGTRCRLKPCSVRSQRFSSTLKTSFVPRTSSRSTTPKLHMS